MKPDAAGISVLNEASDPQIVVALFQRRHAAEAVVAWAVATLSRGPAPRGGARAFTPMPELYALRIRYASGASWVFTRPVRWRPGGAVLVRVQSCLDPAGSLGLRLRESPGRRPSQLVLRTSPCLAEDARAIVTARGVPVLPPLALIGNAERWIDTTPPPFFAAVLSDPVPPGTLLRPHQVITSTAVGPHQTVRVTGSAAAGYSLKVTGAAAASSRTRPLNRLT